MGMPLAFLLLKTFVVLSAFQVQGSAGLNLPSVQATAELFHLKDLKFYTSIRSRLKVLQNAPNGRRFLSDTTSVHPFKKQINGSAPSPSSSFRKNHWSSKLSPGTHHQHQPQTSSWKSRWHSVSPSWSSFPSPGNEGSPAPVPSTKLPETGPAPQPIISPYSSSPKRLTKAPSPSPILTLPPPPPNTDCSFLSCTAPLTYGPAGSPCGCVWPIEVSLRLSVALYTFFPLVSDLAKELSASLVLNRSQVRIMGANAAGQQLEKTTVHLNLVPQDGQFDSATAFSIYRKFWKREVFIRTSLFGTYQVLFVRYPGLPPSPPSLSSATATINSQPDGGIDNNGRAVKPLGVDVPRRRKNGLSSNMVIVTVLSSITTAVVCIGFIWFLLVKCACCIHKLGQHSRALVAVHGQPSGGAGSLKLESKPSSASVSLSSSILPYTGTAKIFSISDIERATENFQASRIIGEGGFGIVYSGILDDGRKVAVKVLKRDDQQGSREFLAEVEMLNRLHHRNLVKLIGICTEAHCRCLVYELVPNGSVESHLHGLSGVDKEATPLDWCARMKIALGAACGLAYLHEDSNPRVIHRDFKSSNILLEHDFTPKVSDFGLARTALDEQSKHISTHVMGTFGYLAPEYAMTGHLLVKSDVYSYGVVLLELLTGRKPVDLLQPPGQENLVAWARPLLTTNEGLEAIIDPALKPDLPFDSVAKFAAIASMCVQPEVSHRPFMGEVVQALKLVCNEFEETRDLMSRSCSQDEISVDIVSKRSRISGDDQDDLREVSTGIYALQGLTFDDKIAISTSNLLAPEALESESFRRQYNSAPLKMGRRRKSRFWERLRGLSRGSMSEHGFRLM